VITAEAKQGLRAFAEEVGFDRVGFTDAEVLQGERDYLAVRGPGPFEPTDLPPRTDPRLLLADARTVMVVAVNYYHPDPPAPADRELRGIMSRYSRGLDYHTVMQERLDRIEQHLADQYGARSVSYVDTGPPLERAFAEKAGLGRLGKNTNLIIRGHGKGDRLGSWVFLGVLVTDLEIEPDPPATYPVCGTCTRCIDACPTSCITPWRVDSASCLGYLNQETGSMPRQHREALGDRVWGCDVCQDVCPYNRTAPAGQPEFEPLPQPGAFPDLAALANMTEDQFTGWFGPTAADWRGPAPLRRNALVAYGNSSDPEAIGPVLDTLDAADPELREHAVWAAGRLAQRFPQHDAAVRVALTRTQDREDDDRVLAELAATRTEMNGGPIT
jgi:epoxyqueuosine reductase